MRRVLKYSYTRRYAFALFLTVCLSGISPVFVIAQNISLSDTTSRGTDTTNLLFPFNDNTGNPYLDQQNQSPLFLNNPSNIKREIIYNPETNSYEFVNKIGDFYYRPPATLDFEDFQKYELDNQVKKYWNERSQTAGTSEGSRLIPKLYVGGEAFETIFGSNTIDIRPQGSAEVSFGILSNKREDPALDVRQRRNTNFDFDMNIQMNVTAKIGDKIEFKANYNTESSFNFENTLKLKYEGKEDEIIQLIEAGNVSMPLRSTLIRGSQSLFGIKTILQFGKTKVTAIYSQQQSETQSITVQGGAQASRFKLSALDYEENKHFFLAHTFRDNYPKALATLPIVSSDVTITRVEVWVTNLGPATEQNRNIVALADLGEGNRKNIQNRYISPLPGGELPSNNSNDELLRMDTTQLRDINTVTQYMSGDPLNIGLNGYMVAGEDYVKLENARKLKETEYKVNTRLGFISLNTTLNPDQVLAVAVQYTVIGHDSVFQIGEFSDYGITPPKSLILKLLKSSTLDTKVPLWDLMMKNVYPIGAYQVQREDFRFNILYSGNQEGIPTGYFSQGPEEKTGIPLIHLFGLDNLDYQMNPIPGGDGLFDYIDGAALNGGTIQASNGRIFFTSLEPFGSYIRDSIFPDNPEWADFYAYDSLYTLTKTGAEQYPDKNKYILEGMYKSQSGSDISLNALNVPQGSVTVTAGGVPLTENVDYTVDYTLGRVKIINEGILNSGVPINVSLESNSLFNVQQKRMMGIHVDHEISKDFHIGGTLLNLHERPLTQKVNYGDDPVSNTIWGVDLSYRTESRWLTKLINNLPGISSNKASTINIDGEFAQFFPGNAKAVGKSGISYVDDFEGAKSSIDLRNIASWFLASTPQLQPDMFPETNSLNSLAFGYNRARLAWYIIDPLFYDRRGIAGASNVTKESISLNSTRQVLQTEVFPNKSIPNGSPLNIGVFNLAYFPEMRGSYNYDVKPTTYSSGIDEEGDLKDPETRWGGIMRRIESTDFQSANIEYIEFWMMDPFAEAPFDKSSGELYINLGDISEDILRDGRRSYENGLPESEVVANVDTTIWGRVPNIQALTQSFSNTGTARTYQDVGYDGLGDNDEESFFNKSFLNVIREQYGQNSPAYQKAIQDPSTDNYHYYMGSDYDQEAIYSDITTRYLHYNNAEGNSPSDETNPESYPTAATNLPNVEDINEDNTLSESERYFQYRVKLSPEQMKVGKNFIADVRRASGVRLPNGDITEVNWYQFKIPIQNPSKIVGNISNFQSIRFMRVFLKDWDGPVVLRFATFELVRNEWRRYENSLLTEGEYIPNDNGSETSFVVSTVNIEENANREPVPYVIPPGIQREVQFGTTNYIVQNEQSLALNVTNLQNGDARGVYKTTDFDFRQYKFLKMFVHAEAMNAVNDISGTDPYDYGDMTVFIRIGSDFTNNYYEYEIPVKFTPWGTTFTDPEAIWPAENNMDIDLNALVQTKLNRNIAMLDPNTPYTLYKPYVEHHGNARVTVLGNPNIGTVSGILIGVRNPKTAVSGEDYTEPINAIVWVDELRLTDMNKKPGWATTARFETLLSDLGKFALGVSYSSPRFGGLEQKITQLSLQSTTDIIFTTDLDMGKFFGQKTGIRIPVHYDYNSTRITPEYNPLDPDIKLKDALDIYTNKQNRDSIKRLTEDFTQRQNFSVLNMRKDRTNTKRKPRVYDIENFDASFAYSTTKNRNIDFVYNDLKDIKGGLGYNWNGRPKNYKPFSKVKAFKSKHLALIRDFNIYLLPKVFSFRTDMTRRLKKQLLRDKSIGEVIIFPTYERIWNWNRKFDLKYDFSRSLKFEFNAGMNTYIDEPQRYPEDKNTSEWDDYKKQIWAEIGKFGTKQRYNQSFKITYNLPMRKIPILDWTTIAASYGGLYSWSAAPISVQKRMGNIIENSSQRQLNGSADLNSLYNKIPYFKSINKTNTRSSRSTSRTRGTRQQKPPTSDTIAKPQKQYGKIIGEGLLRILMFIKKANVTYTKTAGTMLPGFMPEPEFMGISFGAANAPGWGFVFGSQADIRNDAFTNGWLTTDSIMNNPFMKKLNETLSYKVNTNILNAIRIDINGERMFTDNYQSYYRYDVDSATFIEYSPREIGSFSISYPIIKTSFETSDSANSSSTFQAFLDGRKEIAERLAHQNPGWSGEYFYDSVTGQEFPMGYGPSSQEVLYYSFLGSYSGQGTGSINISNPFPKFPIPNWKITFNGLTNIEAIGKVFRTINITSGYRAMLSLTSWETNVNYKPDVPDQFFENSMNYVTRYNVGVVSLIEQFNPLIGVDLTMKNSLSTRIEYKKSRNLALSFVNNQLTQVNSAELVFGFGYRIKGLKFSIGAMDGSGKSSSYKSDLNIKLDFGIRDTKTVLRRTDDNNNQISAGSKQYNLNFTADYMLSKSLQIRAYYNWTSNSPYISTQFPNATTSAGISLRFNLAQ